MMRNPALSRDLPELDPACVVSYEDSSYAGQTKQQLALQQTNSLYTAGVRITIRTEGSVLHQVLIEIDSNRNGSFDDINDAFFSIDPLHASIAAGMGDEGGIIQSPEMVASVLAFIAQLNVIAPEAFERDMRALSYFVTKSTAVVIEAVAKLESLKTLT